MSQQLNNRREQPTRSSSKRKRKSLDGMTCPGCTEHFPSFRNKNQLINNHMQHNSVCSEYIIHCPNDQCKQKFLTARGLDQHTNVSNPCRIAEEQIKKASSFASTAVAIPPPRNIKATNLHPPPLSQQQYSPPPEVIPLTKTNMGLIYDFTDSFTTRQSIIGHSNKDQGNSAKEKFSAPEKGTTSNCSSSSSIIPFIIAK